MSYCLNPSCQNPQNPSGTRFCQSCGTKLLLGDRYRAIKKIGQGGFGRTFLGVDEYKPSKPRCAIKQFFTQGAISQKAAELFQQEAVRLDELGKHPQIPELLAHFEQDSHQYLVQEFIDGQNLAEELAQNGPFNEVQICALLNDLLPVLQFVHDRQVIHRDIKPENIIRRHSDDKLFLVDFGAAKFATGTALLRTGTAIGSAGYVAPEQALGKAVFASDIYSLGITCIQLLTQTDPFDWYSVSEGAWVWRDYLNTSVSDRLGAILDKMLEGGTNRRYRTAADVLQDLKTAPSWASVTRTSIVPALIVSNSAPQGATAATLVVAKSGPADCRTIGEAIESAQPETRILVRPGFYRESLAIDKPLEILGDGQVADITIESTDANCILMQTDYAVVRGLTLCVRVGRKGKNYFTVDIPQGHLVLEDCDITSDSLACVGIHGPTANPTIRRCHIHDSRSGGVFVYEKGQGTVENCRIFSNTHAGVTISKGANPVIRGCKIHHGQEYGVLFTQKGRGTVEECEIFGNSQAGVKIDDGSHPLIQLCNINRNKWGVYVEFNGAGTVQNCDLTDNIRSPWYIAKGCSVRRSGNRESKFFWF